MRAADNSHGGTFSQPLQTSRREARVLHPLPTPILELEMIYEFHLHLRDPTPALASDL